MSTLPLYSSSSASPADSTRFSQQSELYLPGFVKLPRKTTLSHLQRVSSPRRVSLLYPQRKALSRWTSSMHLLKAVRHYGIDLSLFLTRQKQVPSLGRGQQGLPLDDSTVPQRALPQDSTSTQEARSSPCKA